MDWNICGLLSLKLQCPKNDIRGSASDRWHTHLQNILHLWGRKSVFSICNSACHFNATMNLFKQSLYMLVIWMRLCRIKYRNRYYKVLVCFTLAFLTLSVSSGKRKIDAKKQGKPANKGVTLLIYKQNWWIVADDASSSRQMSIQFQFS